VGEGEAVPLYYNRNANLPLQRQRNRLPIRLIRDSILYALEKYRTLILVGETGSGKTTQIPQYLDEAGWTEGGRVVICTQPRRMAAISIATRVAEEMGTTVGDRVGYAVRFDAKYDRERTRIKYYTDGLLLREAMLDPLFSSCSVVMIDEAHERTIYSDILLGVLKKVMRKRPELRIVVSSATMDAELFRDFFETNTTSDPENDTAVIMSVQGRPHPVDIVYLQKPAPNYIQAAVDTVVQIHKHEDVGDVLVFMPGMEEIDRAVLLLKDHFSDQEVRVLPLHGSLPIQTQLRVFQPAPHGVRKVIVATNIAETSLTIEGVRYVVDTGFVRMPYFDVENGLESLIVTTESKASATQRAGRAGRTEPGKCFRLFTEEAFNQLRDTTVPEIQRSNMAWPVLQLKALGIDDILHFDFLSSPPAEVMMHALELLYSLGALDEEAKLTPLGRDMAEFPCEPRLAKLLLSSFDFGCVEEMLTLVAMLSIQHPFIQPRSSSKEAKQKLHDAVAEFAVLEGDHITLINVYNGFEDAQDQQSWCDQHMLQRRLLQRAVEVRSHLKRVLQRVCPHGTFSSCVEDISAICRCLVSGFFSNAAQLANDGRYRTVRGKLAVDIHPSSVLAK
jgi:ATP-dependent RNA helicase DDX35